MFEKLYKNYDGTASPHCLIELDRKQLSRFEKYTIHIQNLSLDNGLHYQSIKYGRNVRTRSQNGQKKIMLSKMLKNYLLITADKDEVINNFKDIVCISECDLNIHLPHERQNHHSGVVVLALACYNKNLKFQGIDLIQSDTRCIKSCKNNIITKSNNHFQCVGMYYSFGNRAQYKIADGSSVALIRSQ